MARYLYECDKGHVTQRFSTIANRKDYVMCPHCGKRASQTYGANVAAPSTWANPVLSDAMGVHPSQRKEAYEYSVKIGVPTTFDKEGRAEFHSRQHRRDYCNHFGVHDFDGGYGDP